jgi:hypothetical protein
MSTPKFFDKDYNNVMEPYIIKCIRSTLGLSEDTNCSLYRDERKTKVRFDDDQAEMIIQKAGNDFFLYYEGHKEKKSFHINQVRSLMVLDKKDATRSIVDPDHLVEWLPHEHGVAYFGFNELIWYSVRSLNKMIENLPSKDHLWKRDASADDYADLNKLKNLGLIEINGLDIRYLNETALRLTFINKCGLESVLTKKRNKYTKNAMSDLIRWYESINQEKCEERDPNTTITFNNKRLRLIENKVSLADFICAYCDKNDARTNIKHLKSIDDILTEHKFAGPGQRPTPVVLISELERITKQLPKKLSENDRSKLLTTLEEFLIS